MSTRPPKKNPPPSHPNSKASKRTNHVRIIGGQFKRRQLSLVDADGLRPTPDRVRETIFNWLMGEITHSRVLDMCAGSGAFGFECLSRGADFAVMIEPIKAQAVLLTKQAHAFGVHDKTQIHHANAQDILPTLTHTRPFDIVFIDPPYALNLWQTLITSLIQHKLIHANSLIYIEGDCPLGQMIDKADDFVIIKQHRFGQIYAYIVHWQYDEIFL